LKAICNEIKIGENTHIFQSSKNRINSLAQLSPIVDFSGTLNSLASVLLKISNDVRFLSSGPRSGFGELTVPENEPGSSIMPGKVNPTQCESLSMVSAQVIGNHQAVTIANASALFESNTFKPLIANNLLRSARLISDGLRSFRLNCVVGINIVESKMKEELELLYKI
jgi:fumarate hydratase class II